METFNIPYLGCYQFRSSWYTTVTELSTGKEQRIANWDRAKRAWTIELKKDIATIGETRDFVNRHKGKYGDFLFPLPPKNSSDVPEAIVAHFDSDNFDAAIQYNAAGVFTLTIVESIPGGDPPANTIDTFNIPFLGVYKFRSEWNTTTTPATAGVEERWANWDAPRYRWEIEFKKDLDVIDQARIFFDMKMGKYRKFLFNPPKQKTGDFPEPVYARFDTDEFKVDIRYHATGTFILPIIEVR